MPEVVTVAEIDPVFISIADAGRYLAIGEREIYRLIDRNELESVRIGRPQAGRTRLATGLRPTDHRRRPEGPPVTLAYHRGGLGEGDRSLNATRPARVASESGPTSAERGCEPFGQGRARAADAAFPDRA
jgi:excisionase family DNA binding protein